MTSESGTPYYPSRKPSEVAEAGRLLDELHDACRTASHRGVGAGIVYYPDGEVGCFVNRGRFHEPATFRLDDPAILPWLRLQITRVRNAGSVEP